jgi:hypothetical protein
VKGFNRWLDKNHKPQDKHTLRAALAEYEKEHGYKRGKHSLHGGEFKAPDADFAHIYSQYLAKSHPVRRLTVESFSHSKLVAQQAVILISHTPFISHPTSSPTSSSPTSRTSSRSMRSTRASIDTPIFF